ncbi:MAG: hypothetical protein H7334_07160 [Ferruginibacter sp.]|nr:hypothetical protein [Ferruginibacter sp.]
MITYVELWKTKKPWLNLSKIGRREFMDALGPAMQHLLNSGVKVVIICFNNTEFKI